jgi:hypothetical protein
VRRGHINVFRQITASVRRTWDKSFVQAFSGVVFTGRGLSTFLEPDPCRSLRRVEAKAVLCEEESDELWLFGVDGVALLYGVSVEGKGASRGLPCVPMRLSGGVMTGCLGDTCTRVWLAVSGSRVAWPDMLAWIIS